MTFVIRVKPPDAFPYFFAARGGYTGNLLEAKTYTFQQDAEKMWLVLCSANTQVACYSSVVSTSFLSGQEGN